MPVGLVLLGFACVAGAQTPPPPPTPTPAAVEVPVPAAPPPATPAVSPAPAEAPPPTPNPTPVPPSERIVGIRVVGYQTVSPETISHYLGVKAGDPYDPEKIRENFPKLWEVGLLENLSIEAERDAAGVTLVVSIEERPTISVIDFTGNKKVSTSTIRDRLKEQKVEVKQGAPLSLRDVAKARSAISDLYVEQGFRSATVDFNVEDVSKTEKKVVFVIDEGEKVKIASIEFEGNTVVSDRRLRMAMKKTKVNAWFRPFSDKTTFSQANYDEDVENIKALYQARGYKDVVLKDPKVDIFVVNPDARPNKIKRRARITIPVVEGEQFYTGDIRVARVNQSGQPADPPEPTVLPASEILKEFFELKPGTVLNRDRIIEALQRVEARYKSRGYIYWFAEPVYTEAADRKVDIELKLYEGDKFYLGRLEVAGNTTTRDKVIRREFALDEGDIMNMEAIKKSLQKLQQLGYFKISEEPEFSVRPAEKKVDMVIKGTEASKNEIQFGAGYSALDGFFGQFSFQTRNFLGRGEVIGAAAQIGRISNYYDLSYTVPWFMDRNQTVGVSLFSRNVEYLNIDERRQGGTAFYGKGIGLFDSWSVLYSYEDVKANFPVLGAQVPPGQPSPPAKLTEVTGTTSSLTPGYRFDSRNDPFDPNRGYRLYLTTQFAGSVLGGNQDFVKPLLGGSTYIPIRFPRRAYLGVNLELGYVAPTSGGDIPIFERFQIGGESSLRGFRTGSVLPLRENDQVFTDETGRILGGDKYFILNAEYVFATIGPAKILVFGDAGNAYHEDQSIDFSNIRTSVGAELRIFLPIFQAPLRFIYSFNLDPKEPIDQFGFPISRLKERRSGFDFSIGRTF
ncbi:MAG TPA: outer membrane protein assembly factor BamA [Thermoanaerobaculia bacterium]|nr:outer membrane protein assembly factor BamA [Thermoanaerobaculia bacterium]